MRARVRACVRTCVRACVRVCVRVRVDACVCVCMRACVRAWMQTLCVNPMQGINKGVSWVSVRLSQGTVVAGSMISQVCHSASAQTLSL